MTPLGGAKVTMSPARGGCCLESTSSALDQVSTEKTHLRGGMCVETRLRTKMLRLKIRLISSAA